MNIFRTFMLINSLVRTLQGNVEIWRILLVLPIKIQKKYPLKKFSLAADMAQNCKSVLWISVLEFFSKCFVQNKFNFKAHPEKIRQEFWIAWSIGSVSFEKIQFLRIFF